MFPGKRILARCYMLESAEASYIRGGMTGARLYFDHWRGVYDQLLRGGVEAVEGPNEHWPSLAELPEYVSFACEWVRLVGTLGPRPAWVTSTGRPALTYYHDAQPTERDVAPIWEALEAHNGIWAPHEYGAPTLRQCAPWLTLRYRLTIDELASVSPLAREVPIIVSECGVDGGVDNHPGWGWKRYMNKETYQAELAWYDDELCRDPQVLAATPFTTCPTSQWASYDVDGEMLRWMADRYNGDVIPPEPEPPDPINLDELRRLRDQMRGNVSAAMARLDDVLDDLDRLDEILR
jgi:hypothetical protein